MMWSGNNKVSRGIFLAFIALSFVYPFGASAQVAPSLGGVSSNLFGRRFSSPFNQALLINLNGNAQVINFRDAKLVANSSNLAQVGNNFVERSGNVFRQLVINPLTGQLFGATKPFKVIQELTENFLLNIDKFRNSPNALAVRNFLLANGAADALRGNIEVDAGTGVLPDTDGFENYSASKKASAILTMFLNSMSTNRSRISIPPERFNRAGVASMNLNGLFRGEALALLLNNNPYQCEGFPKPRPRLDWLVTRGLGDPQVYVQVLGLSRTVEGLADQTGTSSDPRETDNNAILIAGGSKEFKSSGVVESPRRILQFEPMFKNPGGVMWTSFDSLVGKSGKSTNQSGDPAKVGKDFIHDGTEKIFNLPNGYQAYFLGNGAGARVDEAPARLVTEDIATGADCMKCHQGPGIRGFKEQADGDKYPDYSKVLSGFGNKFTDMQRYAAVGTAFNNGVTNKRKAAGAWLENPAIPGESLDLINGTINAYKKGMSEEQVAKELGASVAELPAILPTVQGFRNPDGTLPREVFENYYCNFKVALATNRQRSLVSGGQPRNALPGNNGSGQQHNGGGTAPNQRPVAPAQGV